MLKRLLWFTMASSSCLITCTVHAAWTPRVTGLGEMGEYGSLWGDGLFPVQDVPNQVIFFDFQVEANRFYSGKNAFSGIGSPGLGMRHAFPNDNVLGLYLFSDYMMTNTQQNYWFISPGMDFYRGPVYAALNGYIPVNNAPRQTGPEIAASNLGITQYEILTGHAQYDRLIQSFYSMRWGMDLTGGILFGDRNEWGVKLGGYLYDAQHLNIIEGGRAGIDYYFNDNMALTFEERYDNVFHNQTLVGIKISFLGKDNRGTVKTQLKAPIYRNLNINTTNAGTPIGTYQQTSAQSYLIQNHITFVTNVPIPNNPGLLTSTITGDGTYENPYTGLDQTTLDSATATQNTKIWVEGTSVSYADAATLALNTEQAIYGRTAGFKLAAASVSSQPIFDFAPNTTGMAALTIDNTNSLQNFIMRRNGGVADSIGIDVINSGAGTATINGVTIGTTTTTTGYATALYNNGGKVSINNATLYAIEDTVNVSGTTPSVQGVFGVYNNGGTVTITDSTVSASANTVNYPSASTGHGVSGGAWGIYNTTGGVTIINQSEVNAQANAVNYNANNSIAGGDLVGAFGVSNNTGTMTLSNSTVNATTNNVVDTRTPTGALNAIPSTIGAFGLYNTRGTMTIKGSSSSINATATNVDNLGYDTGTYQQLLDYVGAFSAYNDGEGGTATLDIQQAHLTTSATTVSTSIFDLNDPTIAAIGVWNYGNTGTADAKIEQSAKVDVNADWQIASTSSQGSAVKSIGLYNEGYLLGGKATLTTDTATINVTETGDDGSGSGLIAGILNGAPNGNGNTIAISTIKATYIKASAHGGTSAVYGFENYGSYDDTTGTIIEKGSIIDAEGEGSTGVSAAVYNSTYGNMSIQGTAKQNVTLIANAGGSNFGVSNDNGSNMTINYATISVGSGTQGYSIGVNNTASVAGNAAVAINHVTANVSSSSVYNAYGVYNSDAGTAATISNSTFNIITSASNAYGVDNSETGSIAAISNSTFNITTSGTGIAYGLWDETGTNGIIINSPTALNLNYDPTSGNAYAFSLAGIYIGKSNVTCKYNGAPTPCTTG